MLVGPSGCGKSTLLRTIAGLEEVSDGTIEIGGEVVNDMRPRDRDVAMVFQDYALYPHMTVGQQHRLRPEGAQDARGGDRSARRRCRQRCSASRRSSSAIRASSPAGQRQRVAIGRAIVRNPQIFLFDEPLSNLDAQLRDEMRGEIKRLHQEISTHDDLRHPRPDRGDDARRPHRSDARRPDRAGRARRSICSSGRRPASSPASSARRR